MPDFKKPTFATFAALEILLEGFDVTESNARLTALGSYDDQNWLVSTGSRPHGVLKVYHQKTDSSTILLVHKALKVLEAHYPAIKFPQAVLGKNHQALQSITRDGATWFVCLYSWIEGSFLAEDDKVNGLTLQQFASWGQVLGRINQLLRHQVLGRFAHKNPWDLRFAFDMHAANLEFIESPEVRRHCYYFLQQFDHEIRPLLETLPSGYIHGDGHEGNLLWSDEQIVGVIDFGDMAYGPLIFELAIALTYASAFATCDRPRSLKHTNEHNDLGQSFYPSEADLSEFLQSQGQLAAAYHKERPLTSLEVSLLWLLLGTRAAVSLCSSYATQNLRAIALQETYIAKSRHDMIRLLDTLLRLGPYAYESSLCEQLRIQRINDASYASPSDAIKRRLAFQAPFCRLSYGNNPLIVRRGAFNYLYGEDDASYVDLTNNVSHIGHNHPSLVRAITRQAHRLNTNSRYVYEEYARYCQRLEVYLPRAIDRVIFTNSGSEAMDLALRLAHQMHDEAGWIIVLEGAYHGHTKSLIPLSSYKQKQAHRKSYDANPWIRTINSPFTLDTLRKTFANWELQGWDNHPVLAVIVESFPSCAGQIAFPANYLKDLYEFARKKSAIVIADEVQSGFGRIGSHFWGFEAHDVTPDIIAMGKSMGGGMPFAGIALTNTVAQRSDTGMEYFNSFGGNPLAMAAGTAVLDVLEAEGLMAHALTCGEFLNRSFEALKTEGFYNNKIIATRGQGLFWGIQLRREDVTHHPARQLAQRLREQGFLVSYDGAFDDVLKIKPPMTVTLSQLKAFMETFASLMSQ